MSPDALHSVLSSVALAKVDALRRGILVSSLALAVAFIGGCDRWQRSVEARKQAAHDGLTARKTFLSAALPESERSAVPRNRNEYADDVCALKSVLLNCDKADY